MNRATFQSDPRTRSATNFGRARRAERAPKPAARPPEARPDYRRRAHAVAAAIALVIGLVLFRELWSSAWTREEAKLLIWGAALLGMIAVDQIARCFGRKLFGGRGNNGGEGMLDGDSGGDGGGDGGGGD
jgi:uncharacterized membrane protein YgcG